MFRAAGQPHGGNPRLQDPGVRGPDEDPGQHRVREQQHHQHQRAHPRHRGPHEPRHREQANRNYSLAFLLYQRNCFLAIYLNTGNILVGTYLLHTFIQTSANWQKIDPELLQETKCMMFYIPRIKSADGLSI